MKLKDAEGWQKTVDVNDDAYGACVVRYCEKWTDLMEKRINAGEKLADIAKETAHEADTEGTTGFMYGCAVSILSQVWEHGEELRRWHNLDCQIGNEGEKANENDKVLNPAIINIG
jgi:urate oxidase